MAVKNNVPSLAADISQAELSRTRPSMLRQFRSI